ncbi:hypothetical protein [Nonomuraea sp. NPDC005650]
MARKTDHEAMSRWRRVVMTVATVMLFVVLLAIAAIAILLHTAGLD